MDYLDWWLSAAGVECSDHGVDRIDEMVAPEETISVADEAGRSLAAARSSPPLSSDSRAAM